MCKTLQLLYVILVGLCWAENYNSLLGYQIWNIVGLRNAAGQPDREKLEVLGHLRDEGFDFLKEGEDSIHILVPRKNVRFLQDYFWKHHIDYEVTVKDIGKRMRDSAAGNSKMRTTNATSTCTESSCLRPLLEQYMSFQQIEWYLQSLVKNYEGVSLKSLAKTAEGRDIWLIKINSTGSTTAKAIWIEGGIHAREWIASAVALFLIDEVLKQEDMRVEREYYFVPMANPDGYEFSRNTDRMWRKNRRVNGESNCRGVDLNRNWNYKWGVGASNNPCSQVYKGPYPFSEPETKGLSEEMKAIPNLVTVLALHSYSQLLLYPWGWTTSPPANDNKLKNLGMIFANAVQSVYGTQYKVANAASGLYYACGTTDDWAYAMLPVNYSYTLELRDKGHYGFELPENKIAPTCIETWKGFESMARALDESGVSRLKLQDA